MCRLAAHCGSVQPLSTLIYDAPHGLEAQAYRPRELVSGHVNVDGTGVVWWEGSPSESQTNEPLRYVSERTPWSDANLPALSRRLRGGVQLAAVRSATPGIPFAADAVGPFASGSWGFAHNGYLEDFNSHWKGPLLERLDSTRLAEISVNSDSLVLFAYLRMFLEEQRNPTAAISLWAQAVLSLGEQLDRAANLTCVLARGDGLWAMRAAHRLPPNTLYLAATTQGTQLSSEPQDEGPWSPVESDCIVSVKASGWSACDFALAPSPTP